MSAVLRRRVAARVAVVFAAVLLVAVAVLGGRSYCLGECRGPLLDCAETDRIMRRAWALDHGAARRVVRLRTVVAGVSATTCGDVPWNVGAIRWGIGQALGRAGVHQEPVTLTLRFGGPVADAAYANVDVLGIEVRGFDDWETALEVLRGRDPLYYPPGPPYYGSSWREWDPPGAARLRRLPSVQAGGVRLPVSCPLPPVVSRSPEAA